MGAAEAVAAAAHRAARQPPSSCVHSYARPGLASQPLGAQLTGSCGEAPAPAASTAAAAAAAAGLPAPRCVSSVPPLASSGCISLDMLAAADAPAPPAALPPTPWRTPSRSVKRVCRAQAGCPMRQAAQSTARLCRPALQCCPARPQLRATANFAGLPAVAHTHQRTGPRVRAAGCLRSFVTAALPAFCLCVEHRSMFGRACYLAGLWLSTQSYKRPLRSPYPLYYKKKLLISPISLLYCH